MKKKNRLTIGVLCIAAAIGVGALYWYAVGGVSEPVVRAKTEIPAGTQITASMLETIQMGRLNLPENITGSTSQVVGAYASTDISPHDIITGGKLIGHKPAYALKDGQMLYSVAMKNLADSLSGKLERGDIVRVAVPQQSSTGNNVVAGDTSGSLAALQYVRVTSVTLPSGQDTDSASSTSSATAGSTQPATVTLIVNQQQLNALAALGQNEIQLALVSRGDEKAAEQLLAKQDALFTGVN